MQTDKRGITIRNIDWLAVAIGRLDGPSAAAKAIGVSEATIHRWLETGLGKVKFAHIAKLSAKSGISAHELSGRLGPFRSRLLRVL